MGLLFACHGAQKLFGVLGGRIAIHSPLRLSAGLIELVAGTLVAVGFCGRAAAFLASGEMAVAYFIVLPGSRLLAYYQRWRDGGALLFRFSLHFLSRLRLVEPRCSLASRPRHGLTRRCS